MSGPTVLIAAAVIAILISFVEPKWVMAGFLVNTLDEPLRWMLRRGKDATER